MRFLANAGSAIQTWDADMPTVLRDGPFRFFFYAGDRNEPRHVHVTHDDNEAKFWLEPVRLEWSSGFSPREINRIERIVDDNVDHLIEAWNDFFNG